MKKNVLFLILLLMSNLGFAQIKKPFDTFQIGRASSSADKAFIFDTNDGAANPKLEVEVISKMLKYDKNIFRVGDGAAGLKEYRFDTTGGTDASLSADFTTGDLSYNKDNFSIGDGTDTNKGFSFNIGGSNPGLRWNTSTQKVEVTHDGGSYAEVGGGGSAPVLVNATQTGSIGPAPAFVHASANSDIVLTLPLSASSVGQIVEVSVETNSATNTITVAADGSDTIGTSATSVKMVAEGQKLRLLGLGNGKWLPQDIPDQVVWIKDIKASGTQGGGYSTGSDWVTRDLNNMEGDEEIVTSLSANEFTLEKGVYRIKAYVPGYAISLHKGRLYNVTNSTVDIWGSAARSDGSALTTTNSIVSGLLKATTTNSFRLETKGSTTKTTDGLGRASSFSGADEIYTIIRIERLSL